MKNIIGIVVGLVVIGIAWHFLMHGHHDYDHGHKERNDDGETTIAVSFYPLEFAAKAIVGDLAEVVNVGAGRDPHDVQLSTQDVLTLQQADLVAVQGAGLEPWGDDTIPQLTEAGVSVFVATADIPLIEGEEHHHDEHGDEHDEDKEYEEEHEEDGHEEDEDGHDEKGDGHEGEEDSHEDEGEHDEHGGLDPHTWLDPVFFSETVEHLTEAIVAINPDNAETYEANSAALLAELARIGSEYETRLANCSLDETITSHHAFGYIAERYDFEVHSIAGLSTQDVPSATVLAELREEAEEGIGAILLEESSVTAYGETLARETGLQTLRINPIAYAIPDGEDYLSIMRSNLDSFATALACEE